MIEDRNLTVHTDNERTAIAIYRNLKDYEPLFEELLRGSSGLRRRREGMGLVACSEVKCWLFRKLCGCAKLEWVGLRRESRRRGSATRGITRLLSADAAEMVRRPGDFATWRADAVRAAQVEDCSKLGSRTALMPQAPQASGCELSAVEPQRLSRAG